MVKYSGIDFLCFVSAYVLTQQTLRGNETNQAASEEQITRPSQCMIGSAIIEHVHKHDEHYDGALLTLSDWSHQLVTSVASELEVN